MSAAGSSLPKWLESSHNATHITLVLHTLTKRERTRVSARTASRHQSHPSKTHRISHFASTISNNSDHVNWYSVSVGSNQENRADNRYSDIEPYDRTRVIVSHGQLEQGDAGPCAEGRYLNANWVRELAGWKWWIATQAPLPHTAHAFLSVMLQPISRPPSTTDVDTALHETSRIRTVVQLTQNFEHGMRKAHVYFPPLEGESWIVPPEEGCNVPSLKVTLLSSKSIDEAHCVQSTVSIQPLSSSTESEAGEPVIFRHMLYASWPDHGVPVPEDRMGLLNFIRLVDNMNGDLSTQPAGTELDPNPPIMVNCSAGVGRTGAFIALSSLLRAHGFLSPPVSAAERKPVPPLPPSPLGPLPEEIREDLVAQEIEALREQRPAMVQRDDQVLLIYEVLVAAFTGFGWKYPANEGR